LRSVHVRLTNAQMPATTNTAPDYVHQHRGVPHAHEAKSNGSGVNREEYPRCPIEVVAGGGGRQAE